MNETGDETGRGHPALTLSPQDATSYEVSRTSLEERNTDEREDMAVQNTSSTTKKRRRVRHTHRRDAGSSRMTSRDVDILRLGAEQTFVRYDTAGEYLAPGYVPALAKPTPEQLADTTPSAKRAWPADLRHRLMAVTRLLNKLERRGSVEIVHPWADQPAWFRTTAQGLRSLSLDWEEIPFPDTYEKVEARLRHDRSFVSHNHLLNQVWMLLARGGANMPTDHEWRGERAIEIALPPRAQGTRRPHKADGVMLLKEDGSWPILSGDRTRVVATVAMKAHQIVGIEVECTQKNDHRYQEILPDLVAHHDYVWYFCLTPTIRKAISDARKTLPTDDQRQRVRLLLLEEYLQWR